MFRPSTSAAGVRFLAAIKEGRGLKIPPERPALTSERFNNDPPATVI